jgi:quercetin dioxygenase-like cupin family protein
MAAMKRLVALGLLLVVGCGRETPRLLTAAPPRAEPVAQAAPPLAAGENIKLTELRRSEHASVSLVQVRDREAPHIHTRYDLTITMIRGTGTLWLDGTALPMRAGDVAFIPRRTPHHFVNGGQDPALALVSFAPAFSGPDQEPVGVPP